MTSSIPFYFFAKPQGQIYFHLTKEGNKVLEFKSKLLKLAPGSGTADQPLWQFYLATDVNTKMGGKDCPSFYL